MGDWDDVFGNGNPEWCGKEDDPDEVWSHLDNTCYQDVLKMAKLGLGFHMLVIDNHVFVTFEEAANAARELAIRTQSAVKIFISHEEEIYSIYDPEMAAVINSVKMCEIDNLFYPKSPLIRLRKRDMMYHENKGNWLFVAHPNGKTENLERKLRACMREVLRLSYFNPFDQIEKNDNWKYSERLDILNRSLNVATISERDDILKRASEIAKAHKIEVYVVRLVEKTDNCEIFHGSPRYVMFTEEILNILIEKHIEWVEECREKEQQKLNEEKELYDYNMRPEIMELKKSAKEKISVILHDIINSNYMLYESYDEGLHYGESNDLFFLVTTDNNYKISRNGIFQLIHLIMREEGIYKMILSDIQYDGINGVIANHPVSIFRHAGISECKKLQSTLDEIYKESIAFAAGQLKRRVWGGCIRENNYKLHFYKE